jgi:hypothetical protein
MLFELMAATRLKHPEMPNHMAMGTLQGWHILIVNLGARGENTVFARSPPDGAEEVQGGPQP